jgi:SAM-dependent methyltransferase
VIGRNVQTDWPAYLDRFHAERPGITEALLDRCRDENGVQPYQWLAESVGSTGGTTLDLACGSGPTHQLVHGAWVGVDRSPEELERASASQARPLVRADASALPLADGGAGRVLCSMAMMLLAPLGEVLGEVRRVLAPGGTLHLLLPARRPLRAMDTWRYLRLYLTMRSPARFPPSPLRAHPERVLDAAGFHVLSSDRRRFAYPLSDSDAARRFVDALYLPGVSVQRRDDAVELARRWQGDEVGVALHRIVARHR